MDTLSLIEQITQPQGYCPCHTCAMRNRIHSIDSLSERQTFLKAGIDAKELMQSVKILAETPVDQVQSACELLESVGCKEEADCVRILMEPQEKLRAALVELENVKQQREAAQPKITV